jgi:hypothetical protein
VRHAANGPRHAARGMRYSVFGIRYSVTFAGFPYAARLTPHASSHTLLYIRKKKMKKIEKKFAKNFILAPAGFNIAIAIQC